MEKSEWVRGAVHKFEARLVRYTSRLVPEANAREIVQEAFLRLWQQDARDLDNRLAEWLYTVCRNQAIDARRKYALTVYQSADGAVLETPETETVRTEEAGTLMALVRELPPDQEEVIRLKFQDDLSYKEISAITGHSVSYVGVLIHEAVSAMREKFGVKK